MSGFGLIISNYSATMQQAMFVMFFFLMVFILMSGLFTPVRSMPDWAQWIAAFNLFYSGYAYDFPEGMRADRLVAAVRQDAVFHVGVCRSSRVELPEDKCLIARAGHVWRWMACRMIYKTKPWGVFGL